MSKKILVILMAAAVFYGCGRQKEQPAAVQIGSISSTAADFERDFYNSPYSAADTAESRSAFLENYINRMLILREAVDKKLDRDKEFLRSVEAFWQQSLIKLMLDRKIREIAGRVNVSDAEIQAYYDAHKDAEFPDKDLQSAYGAIKWKLLNDKQQDAVGAWLDSLRKSAKIEINKELLKIGEGG